MAVEIIIHSGARQNERITLDGREFRVGSDPDCEVFFDPQRDAAIKGRSAQFRLQEDGWYARCAGGEMSINGRRAVGATHVRSGDVIRLSQSGPEFSFCIVAGARPSPAKAPAAETVSPLPLAFGGGPAEIAPQLAPSSSDASPAGSLQPDHIQAENRQWALWVFGGLAAAILALVAVRSMLSPSTVIVNVGQTGAAAPPVVPPVIDSGSGKADREGAKAGQVPVPKNEEDSVVPDKPKKTGAEDEPKADLPARLKEAVFLVQVEKSDRYWPFATCVAVGGNTLLTTAREAAQLAKWRNNGTFKIWVTQQAGNFKEEVQDIRVLAPFASLAEDSADLFYVDVGLLTVRGPLPKLAPLASPKELDEVEEGLPVACFGFSHDGCKATRFDEFEPRRTNGKVYVIVFAHGLPGQPKVLHVQAEMPKNSYGSPVVNAAGKVIGLYGDAIPESKGLKNLHYVTLVNPELVNLWLRDRETEAWLPAAPVSTTRKTQNEP